MSSIGSKIGTISPFIEYHIASIGDIQRIWTHLVMYWNDFRILAAKAEYDKLLSLLSYCNALSTRSEIQRLSSEYINQLFNHETYKRIISALCQREKEVLDVFHCLENDSQCWTVGGENNGVSTSYRIENDGLLSLKMEGHQEGAPLFEQIALMYEVDCYKKWVPLCNISGIVKQFSLGEFILHLGMGLSHGPARDMVVHSYAADCVYEKHCVVLIGKSIDSFPGVVIPPPGSGYFTDRAYLRYAKAVINMQSSTSARVIVLIKIDLRVKLPQMLINFMTKQVMGMMLSILESEARKVESDKDSFIRKKVAERKQFYIDWLLPKFQKYIEFRQWPQPSIQCLGEYVSFQRVTFDSSTETVDLTATTTTPHDCALFLNPSDVLIQPAPHKGNMIDRLWDNFQLCLVCLLCGNVLCTSRGLIWVVFVFILTCHFLFLLPLRMGREFLFSILELD